MKDAPFYSESQAEFWRHIQPNIRMALEMLEKMESWTYYMEEMPGLFISSSVLLPTISRLPITDSHADTGHIAKELIFILSVMPFRQCIYSLAWLEKHSETEIGWGTLCFIEAQTIFESQELKDKDLELFLAAKIIYSRIQSLIILDVASKVFTGKTSFSFK